jgi:hypothetical protein
MLILHTAASAIDNVGILIAIVSEGGSESSSIASDSSSAVTQCAWRMCTNHGLRLVNIALLAGLLPADFRISRLRFAFSRLRFVWVSSGIVCRTDPASGLY